MTDLEKFGTEPPILNLDQKEVNSIPNLEKQPSLKECLDSDWNLTKFPRDKNWKTLSQTEWNAIKLAWQWKVSEDLKNELKDTMTLTFVKNYFNFQEYRNREDIKPEQRKEMAKTFCQIHWIDYDVNKTPSFSREIQKIKPTDKFLRSNWESRIIMENRILPKDLLEKIKWKFQTLEELENEKWYQKK